MLLSNDSLIQPLLPGPLDIIADVHGEIDALSSLLRLLGYNSGGEHHEGHRLVFLGDLTDRGPDSPAVVELVASLVAAGRAQCILGNHELNLLRQEHKHGNAWFFGEVEALDRSGHIIPQTLADEPVRERILHFFHSLPLALEGEGLRIVHACWHPDAIEQLRTETNVLAAFVRFEQQIHARLERQGVTDRTDRNLAEQNDNPVKVLTSGLETRAERPYEAGGKVRLEKRVAWWNDYAESAWCVFGHYWRVRLGDEDDEDLFAGIDLHAPLGNGRTMCIDYSAGKRWRERLGNLAGAGYRTALAALRWPECSLMLDDGRHFSLASD